MAVRVPWQPARPTASYPRGMFLENLVFDAADPQRLGRFWEQALGTRTLTDQPDGYETRLTVDGGPTLDLCFQQVDGPASPLAPAAPRPARAGRPGRHRRAAAGLGAGYLDIGQGDVPWVVLADPEGHPFCVMEERAAYRGTGPCAAIPILAPTPSRDAAFWSELSGWREYDGAAPVSLRHPSGRGPGAGVPPAPEPKAGQEPAAPRPAVEAEDDAPPSFDRVEALGAAAARERLGRPALDLADRPGRQRVLHPARRGRRERVRVERAPVAGRRPCPCGSGRAVRRLLPAPARGRSPRRVGGAPDAQPLRRLRRPRHGIPAAHLAPPHPPGATSTRPTGPAGRA